MDPGQVNSQPLHKPSAEYFSWEYRVQLIAASFGFYTAIFLLSHFLSVGLSCTYNSLPTKDKVFWNLAATRGAFGLLCTVAGLRALTEESQDRVSGQEDWSWFCVLTVTGFFVFENLALHTSNVAFWSFDLPLATHHVLALAGSAGTVVWDSTGHFIPMVMLLMEMSTPFTCISWMLLKADYAHTVFWKANQWVMIHMFHCRMVLCYYVCFFTCTHWREINAHFPLPQQLLLSFILVLLMFVLNPFWIQKKTKQLLNPVDWNSGNKPVPVNGPEKDKVHSN